MEIEMVCPHGCGNIVNAIDSGFSATTIEVFPCDGIKVSDPAVISYNVRKSVAYGLIEEARNLRSQDWIEKMFRYAE